MRVSIEGFFALNACINAAVLLIALRWGGTRRPRAWRVVLAAALGAGYAIAAYVPGLSFARSLPVSVAVCAGMLWAAASWPTYRHFLRALVLTHAATYLTGGVIYALSQALGGMPPVWIAGALGAWLIGWYLFRVRRRVQAALRADVQVSLDTASAQIDGLIDSGNLLIEPISGLPVIVATRRAVAPLLPVGCDPTDLTTLPEGFRLVCMATASGNQLLMCFQPTMVRVRVARDWQPVDAIVAISLHALPEGDVALVPMTLVSA